MTKAALRAKEDIKVVESAIRKGEIVLIQKTNDKGSVLISNEKEELLVWLTDIEFGDLVELEIE
jgi:hypothetical protein